MEEKIINIIVEVSGDDSFINNLDFDLIESGILDSLAFINLITRLEEEFNVEIQPTQVPASTWRKVNNIIDLIKKLS